MKNYKEFSQVNLGFSDIASLILRSPCKVQLAETGSDGRYMAYECFGDVKIGEHYKLEFEGDSWLKIYDDCELTYYKSWVETGYNKFSVYLSGRTFIIHWHK